MGQRQMEGRGREKAVLCTPTRGLAREKCPATFEYLISDVQSPPPAGEGRRVGGGGGISVDKAGLLSWVTAALVVTSMSVSSMKGLCRACHIWS